MFDPSKSNEVFSHSQTMPVNKREKVKLAKLRNQMDNIMRSNSIINKLEIVEQNVSENNKKRLNGKKVKKKRL